MQGSLSALKGAEDRKQELEDAARKSAQVQEHDSLSKERMTGIKNVIDELKTQINDPSGSLSFKVNQYIAPVYSQVGTLTVSGAKYSIVIDTNTYALFKEDRNLERENQSFEGPTKSLHTFLGALGYVLGRAFPDDAIKINNIIEKHSPIILEEASIGGV